MTRRRANTGGDDEGAASVPRRIEDAELAHLADGFRGRLVAPDDPAYDDARSVWNGVVDKRPALVAYCTRREDVTEALSFARANALPVAVRGGGHNVAGSSVCDDGIVIDMSRMKGVDVDARRRTVRAQTGLTLGELDAATQAEGLATTLGVASTTGVAGLTLGGGFGRLARKHGLTCDNLLSVDIVTADGRMLRASIDQNEDLFWGLRGGGGRLGIATALELRLHAVGPNILRASAAFEGPDVRDAMRAFRDIAAAAPDEVSADGGLFTGAGERPAFGVTLCHVGAEERGRTVLERMLSSMKRYARPSREVVESAPYLEVQSAADATFRSGQRYYWKAQFLNEVTDEAVDALLERFTPAPSRDSLVVFQQVGGAIARIAPAETAYANRTAAFDCFPVAIWKVSADDDENVQWARALWKALRPYSMGGVYANNLGDEGSARIREAYGGNFDRLAALCRSYDPAGVFSALSASR